MNLTSKIVILGTLILFFYIIFKDKIHRKMKDITSGQQSPKPQEFTIPDVSENKITFDSNLFVTVDIDEVSDDEEVLGYDDLLRLSSNSKFHELYISSLLQSLEDKQIYYGNIIKNTKPVYNENHNDNATAMTSNNELISNAAEILHIIKRLKTLISNGSYDIDRRFNVCIQLLDKIIGRDDFKNIISRDIIVFARAQKVFCNNFNNMVIYGDPGCGKSYCVDIVDRIYNLLGITLRAHTSLSMDDFATAYLNEAPRLTRKAMYNCFERIAFFDEAYILTQDKTSIGSNNDDIITTIVDITAEHPGKINLIIAGYKIPMKKFLKANKGLTRRFPKDRRVEFDAYSPSELTGIFINDVFEIDDRILFKEKSVSYLYSLINKHNDKFKNGAGDITNMSRNFVEFCLTNKYSIWINGDYINNKNIIGKFFRKCLKENLSKNVEKETVNKIEPLISFLDTFK